MNVVRMKYRGKRYLLSRIPCASYGCFNSRALILTHIQVFYENLTRGPKSYLSDNRDTHKKKNATENLTRGLTARIMIKAFVVN